MTHKTRSASIYLKTFHDISKRRMANFSLKILSTALSSAALILPGHVIAQQQPRKFLVVEPAVSPQWIEQHGKEYHYIWQSRNDRKNASAWKQYAPNTILSSYFPYMRDPESAPVASWEQSHPDWILYQCDEKNIAFQFNKQITPLNIGNEDVTRWQIKNFLSSWQPDIGLDNFQMGPRENFCGYKSDDGKFNKIYSGPTGINRLNTVKLNWLKTVSQAAHKNKKTITINYSPDVPPDSNIAREILTSIDGMLYEDYWGPPYSKGIYTSNSRMFDLMNFFSLASSMNKSVYFIFQVPKMDRQNIETAMATYLINASDRTAVFITSPQRYGIVPDYKGYDAPVGEACGTASVQNGFLTRHFSGAEVVLRLPDAPPASLRLDKSEFIDVSGNTFPSNVELAPATGIIAYKTHHEKCPGS
ncbi:putative glycoside hydrolase [Burkholderia pseudomultivorans]|uniref:Lipoprotein n=1 Tax=Burkholderia pseudomultivorans TaxID=1207504 RepID=A0ABU2E241_9BURK|nr:putative glycoside hydrolase [Burkholderia pseudomultivorans]MDR8726489.1 hypothetical protein [Burkholderia pseudomultivorans]MDR8736322.1 hypothetical protein [Burkholderia pseudomultivorans]MDR8742136.1 hypothetical protein [Burkholderia pseudomultivorans]MDR8753920.1 hypothetical protein [Burkholderia pseudomultivorans]MDR8778970.1 hypothetical protein [Burkholderia pseudomultivorans]